MPLLAPHRTHPRGKTCIAFRVMCPILASLTVPRPCPGRAITPIPRLPHSKDQLSALAGGYVGEIQPEKMDPRLADVALALERDAYSPVVDVNGRYMIVQRMPRDFLYEAEQLELAGSKYRVQGKLDEAADAYTRALRVYPRFLRALVFLGVTFGQQENPARGAAVLEYAARLYPEDPAAQYNLGIAYEALGRSDDAIRTYRKAAHLQPDLIPAYLNLGGALYQLGRLDEAASAYEAGLQANPLTASLYYNVAQVYEKQGKAGEAKNAAAVAAKIDPKFAALAGVR
jgi:tetratricopeptide (TPR) repeat protein